MQLLCFNQLLAPKQLWCSTVYDQSSLQHINPKAIITLWSVDLLSNYHLLSDCHAAPVSLHDSSAFLVRDICTPEPGCQHAPNNADDSKIQDDN